MSNFVDCDREQAFLLPPDLRDWIPADDLGHFVIEAVERVDLGAFKVNHRGTGSAQYHPRMMLALMIYCYANGIFSSRRIERATHRDIGVRFVAANRHPDHDTIARFRRENFCTLPGRRPREADYDLGLSFLISRLLGEALRVSVGANAVALIKPSPGGESGDTLSATVKALNCAGAVSRVLSADIPSLNGKPAQFFELFQEAYLRELRTTAGDGIAQTELVPGTVSSGFAVSYLPRITGPGEVLVRLFASLRDRPSFTAFTSNNQTIQLPAYASRAIQVTQKIGRGETLMVTGFCDRSAAAGRSGTFDPDLPLPQGARKASSARIEPSESAGNRRGQAVSRTSLGINNYSALFSPPRNDGCQTSMPTLRRIEKSLASLVSQREGEDPRVREDRIARLLDDPDKLQEMRKQREAETR